MCDHYIYLGSPFTSDGSISSAIKVRAQLKLCHALKFISFISKNNDVPFKIKRKLFDAAFVSTVLYGCESWFGGDLKPVMKLYNWCLKQLLGVRKSTCNDLCFLESGCPPLKAYVMSRQRKFFSKMWSDRSNMRDDPLSHSINISLNYGTATSRYLRGLLDDNVDDIDIAFTEIKHNIRESNSSRMQFYLCINPELSVHDIYKGDVKVNEIERISWTRMRLSAHSLAIESGRWNRRGRGRLPVEERLCTCGQIQSEKHVIEECPRTRQIRDQFNFSRVENVFIEMSDYRKVRTIIHCILLEYL